MFVGKLPRTVVSLSLCILMVLSLLSGCGASSEEKVIKETQTQVQTQAQSTVGTTAQEKNFNETGLPIVKEPVTMSIMGTIDPTRGIPWEKSEFFTNMEKLTNVKFEYRVFDATSINEKTNLAFASGDLPDIFLGGMSRQNLSAQTKQGNLIGLNEYIDKYAPNFKGLMNQNVDIKRAVTLPDGIVSSFPFLNMEIEPGMGQCPPDALLIYKPWLDKLGLAMPTNTEELYNVLKAFKEKDPNGNGQADEIPISPRNPVVGLKLMFAMFGVMLDSNNLFLDDNNKIVYVPFTDEFKEGLRYFRKLYKEGLLDQDTFVQKTQQVTAKGSGAEEILGATIASAAFTVVGESRNKDMVFAPIIKAPNGKQIWWNRVYANPGAFVVTSKCKYPDVAVRWADIFYSQEGSRYVWMGVENVNYKITSDGKWDWILKEGETASQLRARATLQNLIGTPPSLCPSIWFNSSDPVEGIANEQRTKMVKDYPGKLRTACPQFYYDEDALKRITTLTADLNGYFDQMFAKFIIGESDIDKEWPTFESTVKKMGVEELVSLTQAAYEAYLKN